MTAGFGPTWIARVHATLLRPVPLADDERADALATVTLVCEAAQASAGWTGLLRMGLLEWIDAARQAARALVGRVRPASHRLPDAPPPFGRSPRGHLPGRLAHDVRLAWRGFRVNRSGVALAVATLALGIGLGTSVFSVLDSMLWRPVPFAEADRLAQLVLTDVRSKVTFNGQMSDSVLLGWRDEHDLFDRVEGLDTPSFVYANDAGAEMIAGASVTPGLFGLLGVPPHIGRVFVEGDGRDGSDDIAVVSDAFWRRRLQGDPGVLDRRIRLDGDDYRIVGVMPAAFRYPNADVEVWVPVDPAARPASSTLRVGSPLVRIAPGRTRDAVAAEVRARGERVNDEHGGSPGVSANLWAIDRGVQDATRRSFWLLAAAAGFLVLIVCANAANLSLARSIGRARDLAVRSALGASRTDVIRGAVVEQAMIAMAGCVGGIALAFGLVRVAMALLPDAMTASTLHAFAVDGRAIGCAAALAMIAAVMSALPAALVASRPSMAGLMADRTRGGSSSAAARRARTALVVVEVALSIVLVVGAALMGRSFLRLAAAETGFDPRGLVYVRVGLPAPAYADAAVRDAFTTDVVDRLRTLPSVTAATTGDLPSERQAIGIGRLESADRPGEQSPRLIVPMHEVPPNYFDSIRLPLLDGRTVAEHGPAGESVVVNRAFAAKFFPGGHAVGSKFRLETGPWQTIVGVAEDARPMSAAQSAQATASYAFYYGPGQAPNALRAIAARSAMAEFRTLLVRSDRPALTAPDISRIVHAADPRVVVWKTAMVEHLYADAIAVPRAMVAIMSVFGAAALMLAAAGLYGVLAYLVAQREREMGIRVALGASASQVGSLVLRSGVAVTLAGIVIGIGLAAMLTQTMRSLLFETGPADIVSMAGSAAVTMACALVACWRPARRAMTADPADLFRAD